MRERERKKRCFVYINTDERHNYVKTTQKYVDVKKKKKKITV